MEFLGVYFELVFVGESIYSRGFLHFIVFWVTLAVIILTAFCPIELQYEIIELSVGALLFWKIIFDDVKCLSTWNAYFPFWKKKYQLHYEDSMVIFQKV